MKRSRLAAAAGLALLLAAGGASAAEVTLLCSNALKSVLEELGPQFEKASGHKLKIEYGSTGPLKAQIEKGQAFDVAILGVEATDDLIKRGKLAAGSRADIARSGMGVAIRKGAAKPDLATTAGLQAGAAQRADHRLQRRRPDRHLSERPVRAARHRRELKSKIRLGRGAEMVGEGKAEIGLTQISEILPVAGAELAGPLPPEIQQYTVFPAAIGAAAAQPEARQGAAQIPEVAGRGKGLEGQGARAGGLDAR